MRLNELLNLAVNGPWINGDNDTQYKINRIDGIAYLSFQGSVSKLDWIQNFSFFIKPYKKMPVRWYCHAGFIKKWKSVNDEIYEALKDDKEIVIAGYSQGAALAVLALEDLQYRMPSEIISAHAWGCPRVVSWISGNIYRRFRNLTIYNFRRDIVGHLPFVVLGYRHVGTMIKIGKAGLYSVKAHYLWEYLAI